MLDQLPQSALQEMVTTHLTGAESVVVAVSGGLDSMVLLDLVAQCASGTRVTVATFDHRTGGHASGAVECVRQAALGYGFELRVGAAAPGLSSETAWRDARWNFLRRVATETDGVVLTAHTRDDQLETVVMRVMRGSGARGLAALYALSEGIKRPLVHVSRADLEQYARTRNLRWVEDPSNASRKHQRNRVRHDLLPAFKRVDPQFEATFLGIAARAAEIRGAFDSCVAAWMSKRRDGSVVLSDEVLSLRDSYARGCAWQAMLASQHVVADASGLVRLSALDKAPSTGWYIELPGGWNVARIAEGFIIVPALRSELCETALKEETHFGRFRIVGSPGGAAESLWTCSLPSGFTARVRAWSDGDRIAAGPRGRRRRVKRFFSEQGIPRIERLGWPVVVHNGEIVWVPGVCRTVAATGRPGQPNNFFVCTRVDR